MFAHISTEKTTLEITYTRMADDTHPVFVTACVSAGCGLAAGERVSTGIPDDTSIKTQVLAPQGVASGMPGKARNCD